MLCLTLAVLIAVLASVVSAHGVLMTNVLKARDYAQSLLDASGEVNSPDPDYPYWNFFPALRASLFNKRSAPAEWSSPCFASNIATVSFADDGLAATVKIVSSGSVSTESRLCSEHYWLLTTSSHEDFSVTSNPTGLPVTTTATIQFPTDISDSEKWDVANKGVRLFQFHANRTTTISNFIRTIDLFKPKITHELTPEDCELNIDFLEKYTNVNRIEPRDPFSTLPPDESEVHSGDFFGLIRLDGLGTMMAWAMGTTTGHTTTALWIEGVLNVCESTTDSPTWPVNGIQCTPYRTWLQQNQFEGSQAVWAPLSAEARAKYNETAALEFFRSVEGLDYGFRTLLWSWLDTESANFPCLPPDFSSNCASWEFLEALIAYVDRYVPDIGYMIWNPGMAKRLGVSDTLRTSDLYKIAVESGISTAKLITIPEQDAWKYNTTRNGEPAVGQDMVCCVFVCNMWKSAGLFGDLAEEINCGELTNWDDYVLTILDPAYHQILGNYTLNFNNYNSKTPYAHMGENCPGLPPNYEKSPTC